MNDKLDKLTPEQENARDALRTLETPADPDYRSRLKQAFMDGTIEPATPESEPVAVAAPAKGRSSWFGWLGGSWGERLTWATAMATLVVAVLMINGASVWEITAMDGDGVVVVDGQNFPMDDPRALAAAIKAGSRVQVPEDAMIEFRSPGVMAFRLTSGTDATIPNLPGRWFGRTATGRVYSGVMRITTGKGFEGARLAIATPTADVEVTGTTMAVICEPEGTCVCVLEGTVKIGEKGGEMALVAEGQRRFIFTDHRPSETADIRPMESTKLTMLREELQAKL